VEEVGWRTKGLTTGFLLPASSLFFFTFFVHVGPSVGPPLYLSCPRACVSRSLFCARVRRRR